jgi:hypothetical protein
VNWAENVTTDGYLVFFTRKWSEPTYEAHVYVYSIDSQAWYEPAPTLRVFAKTGGQYSPTVTKLRSKVEYVICLMNSHFAPARPRCRSNTCSRPSVSSLIQTDLPSTFWPLHTEM